MTSVAEQIREQLAGAGSLLDALDAVRNKRAALVLAATFLAVALSMVVLGGVAAWLTVKSGAVGGLLFLLSALIWAGILLVGTTASGILLADEVWSREPRDIKAALIAAGQAAPRLFGVLLIAAAALLAWLLLLSLGLLICTMPLLGPLLYAILFPMAALATGLLIFVFAYLLLPLAAPCVWNGEGIAGVLATLREVLRRRPLYVFIMFLLLGLIVLVIAGIAGLIVFGGIGAFTSLSLAVIGFGGIDFGGNLGGPGGGYGTAFGFGLTLLILVGGIPSTLVGMKGALVIHKNAIAGLAVAEAAADLQRRVEAVRRRAQEAGGRAIAAKPTTAARPKACPNALCGAPVGPDDTFCTVCGEKLK